MFLNDKQPTLTRRSTILLHVLLALGSLGAVTCYGSDGHVAVEPALHGCCSSVASEPHSGTPTNAPAGSGADSHEHCRDIPFNALIKTASRAGMPAGDLLRPGIPAINLAPGIAQSRLAALSAEVPSYTLHVYTPLATIVLLL